MIALYYMGEKSRGIDSVADCSIDFGSKSIASDNPRRLFYFLVFYSPPTHYATFFTISYMLYLSYS